MGLLLPIGAMAAGFDAQARCIPTAAQTRGPFYPPTELEFSEDLTFGGKAQGERIVVHGRVLDAHCRPVSGAVVELWQADHNGRYHNAKDHNNPAPLDPFFKGQARVRCNANGEYRFTTVKPNGYPASPDWRRPPHLHFRIRAGARDLTTQMYFDGEPDNARDAILQRIPAALRETVIVPFQRADGVLQGRFDIHLG